MHEYLLEKVFYSERKMNRMVMCLDGYILM